MDKTTTIGILLLLSVAIILGVATSGLRTANALSPSAPEIVGDYNNKVTIASYEGEPIIVKYNLINENDEIIKSVLMTKNDTGALVALGDEVIDWNDVAYMIPVK